MSLYDEHKAQRKAAIEHAATTGGMLILVMGQHEVRYHRPQIGEVCISIASPSIRPDVPDLLRYTDVLRLDFDDVENPMDDSPGITARQADQVVAFVKKHKGKPLTIHCFAGISRSRSMAAAIHDMVDGVKIYRVLNKSVHQAVTDAFIRDRKDE